MTFCNKFIFRIISRLLKKHSTETNNWVILIKMLEWKGLNWKENQLAAIKWNKTNPKTTMLLCFWRDFSCSTKIPFNLPWTLFYSIPFWSDALIACRTTNYTTMQNRTTQWENTIIFKRWLGNSFMSDFGLLVSYKIFNFHMHLKTLFI